MSLDRLASALSTRYRLERELGRGGMATVWLARDLKHDRDVALKVLRPELTASLGTERFLAEIRTTARLQHPHIVALFDSGEAAGFLYYVMPCIDGESLRARLDREKRLDVDAMLAVARPVAQALAYAHELGIVRRDIKPENILLSRGQPFVTDFGISRAVSAAGGARLTATGVAVGTPAYMSPEQVFGEAEVDARSDVYSLGCVIYEMLSGSPPFTASTIQAMVAKRLTGPPPHLANVPAPVDEAVRKALATAPQDRFATALALADALLEAARKPPTREWSLVVLPFENLSPDPDNAFFADGLTEEIIADLSKIEALRVISRTSAMTYKAVKRSIPVIARELNVRYVLEGSVRRAGDRLRITAQLIEADTGVHLWAEKYAGALEDVFDLQEQLSRQIADALRLKLTPDENRRLGARPMGSIAAYECYLRGMQSMWRCTESGLKGDVAHLERGLEIERDNAQLRGALAYVFWQHANWGLEPYGEFRSRAREHAEQALALDPEASLAHLSIGLLSAWENPGEGIRSFKRALRADPANVEALIWLVGVTSHGWKPEVARVHWQTAHDLDPLHPLLGWLEGACHLFGGDFERAVDVFRRDLSSARLPLTVWFLGLALAYLGRREEACLFLEDAFRDDPTNFFAKLCRGYAAALDGHREAALEVLRTDLDGASAAGHDFMYALFLAECHALVGDTDGAFEWLERSVGLGMMNYPFLARHDPFLAPLRPDPRFPQLMARVKKAWEEFED
ncbi:MAG: hypothetical protein FIA95_12590 [Gemmatimonadetes bacterium]|nr:hypothetical protein [Gemmatimonadota bacterium]